MIQALVALQTTPLLSEIEPSFLSYNVKAPFPVIGAELASHSAEVKIFFWFLSKIVIVGNLYSEVPVMVNGAHPFIVTPKLFLILTRPYDYVF